METSSLYYHAGQQAALDQFKTAGIIGGIFSGTLGGIGGAVIGGTLAFAASRLLHGRIPKFTSFPETPHEAMHWKRQNAPAFKALKQRLKHVAIGTVGGGALGMGYGAYKGLKD